MHAVVFMICAHTINDNNATHTGLSRREIVTQYADYAQQQLTTKKVTNKACLVKPLHNLFDGVIGAKIFRRNLGEFTRIEPNLKDGIMKSIQCFSDATLDSTK